MFKEKDQIYDVIPQEVWVNTKNYGIGVLAVKYEYELIIFLFITPFIWHQGMIQVQLT